jgi:peptidoglycan hydrolase-like protein with peptidoglycan-binding domain
MRLRKITCLGLSLLIVAGLGVFAVAGKAQSPSAKKSTRSRTSGAARGRKSTRRYARRERGQKAPTPDRVSEIQQALAKDGSYAAKPNGKWDDSTVEAMKKFQESHGLSPTGKLDAKTLQQLGLGSETAGAARPLPSSSNSKLTPPTQAAQRRK